MKKISIIVCALVMGISACIASNSASNSFSFVSMELAAPSINVPTGVFWDGRNFIKVESNWLRICINGSSREYNFSAQLDPNGNYVLIFGEGECITMRSNGRTLVYNGTSYSKR